MNTHANIPWTGALRPGDRVVYQPIVDGRFGKVERSDVGTVEFDTIRRGFRIEPCLIVRWDRGGDVDMITDTGQACRWDYQVNAFNPKWTSQ